jgi:DHA2 family methylenomycin A resistance protein-like MFS transporter
VIDGYTLAFASLLLLAGGLGDRLGAKRVFTAGFVVFTLAAALCGAAPGLGTLILARVVQGAGAALFMPSSLAILREWAPGREGARAGHRHLERPHRRRRGVRPALRRPAHRRFGWQSIFLLDVPVGVVAVAMALRFVGPSAASARRGFDLPAQLTGAGALALFTWALIERSARGWSSPVILLIALVAAVAGLRAFVALERRSADPILPPALFANRTFSATAAAALLYAGAFFGSVLVFSLYFQRVRGDSPVAAGLHIAAITASFGLTSVLAGRLAGRYGTRGPILAGLAALSASAWLFAALPETAPFVLLAPPLMLMGFGAGLVAPSMNAAILAGVPPAHSAARACSTRAGGSAPRWASRSLPRSSTAALSRISPRCAPRSSARARSTWARWRLRRARSEPRRLSARVRWSSPSRTSSAQDEP